MRIALGVCRRIGGRVVAQKIATQSPSLGRSRRRSRGPCTRHFALCRVSLCSRGQLADDGTVYLSVCICSCYVLFRLAKSRDNIVIARRKGVFSKNELERPASPIKRKRRSALASPPPSRNSSLAGRRASCSYPTNRQRASPCH